MEPLHQRLIRIRQQRGLTAKAVARAIGVAESTYRQWENGKGRKLPPFQKLSEVLSISVTELLIGQKPEIADVLESLANIEQEIRELRLKLGTNL